MLEINNQTALLACHDAGGPPGDVFIVHKPSFTVLITKSSNSNKSHLDALTHSKTKSKEDSKNGRKLLWGARNPGDLHFVDVINLLSICIHWTVAWQPHCSGRTLEHAMLSCRLHFLPIFFFSLSYPFCFSQPWHDGCGCNYARAYVGFRQICRHARTNRDGGGRNKYLSERRVWIILDRSG